MNPTRRALAALLLATVATFGWAQDRWPSKPIRMVLPIPPGTAGDTFARHYAAALQQALGVPVNVDNKPGATGILGADAVAKAAPDGYTLLFGYPQLFSMNPFLFNKLPYDAEKDFVPIAHLYAGGFVLLATNSFAPRNVQQMVDLAKKEPGKINYGSYGPATQSHLGFELIQQAANIQMVHVPYRTGVMTDLISGQVQLLLEPSGSAIQMMQAGRARALAVTTAKRLEALPDVPAIAETLPGVEMFGMLGVWGPGGLPREIVSRLSSEFVRITKMPEMAAKIREAGFEPTGLPAEELAAVIRKETQVWGGLIRAKNIKLD